MLTLIFALCLALGVSFVCSFVEAGLLSLTPANVAGLAASSPSTGRIWQEFKQDIGKPISVILMLNTTAHTIGAAVAGAKVGELWGDQYLWIFSLVFTFLMLQYTEILPKTLGVRYRLLLAEYGAKPLYWAVRALSPVIRLIHLINRPFEPKAQEGEGEGANAVQEIAALAAEARIAHRIGSRQERIIATASQLDGISARQVMIPVEQVMFLSTHNTIQEAFLMAHVDLHTRYPVRDGDIPERIVGYVNFKELVYFMSTNPRNPSLLGIIRPINFISPDTTARELMRMFVEQYNHMMVVRESTGPAIGIVTLEDVIEEMVGEIEDEFDRLPQYVHVLAGGTVLAGGGARMQEIAARLDETLPAGVTEEETVSVWMAARLGDGFARGDCVKLGKYEFSIRRIKRGRVFDVSILEQGSLGSNPANNSA